MSYDEPLIKSNKLIDILATNMLKHEHRMFKAHERRLRRLLKTSFNLGPSGKDDSNKRRQLLKKLQIQKRLMSERRR